MSVAPPSSFRDPFAPPSKPLPPPPPVPFRQRPVFWVLVAMVALVVVGASAALTIFLWPRKLPALPYDATRLPESLRNIQRWKHDAKVPRELVASELATLCGGVDITSLAMDTERDFAKEVLADAIREREETQKHLRCGAALAKNLGDGPRYSIELKNDDKTTSYVDLFPFTLGALPSSGKNLRFSSGPKSLSSIACVLEVENATCPERALGVARIAETSFWLSGRIDALDTIASAYRGRSADETTRAMNDLALRFAGFDQVEIGGSESHLAFGALSMLNDFATETTKSETAFKKAMEAGNAVYAFGEDIGAHDHDRERLEISVKREEDATAIAKALKELRITLKHTKDPDYPASAPRIDRKAHEAFVSMYRRAIDDAEVVQNGTTVVLELTLHAEPDEKTALLDREKDRADRAKHAVDLYKALLEGKAPSDDVIQVVGGRDLARAIADRKVPPPEPRDDKPPIESTKVKGFLLPAGPESAPSEDGEHFTYNDTKEGFYDDVIGRLRAAGWSVRFKSIGLGPSFECVKDDRVVELSMHAYKKETYVSLYPE